MGLNDTPISNRFTIGIYGRRNAGKSSLINAITDQNLALTSPIAGTTTDPVSKAMEILPIGPVLIIDTAGIDDEGPLGEMRVEKSYEALRKCNLVILVCDATLGPSAYGDLEVDFLAELKTRKIPAVIALNKIDCASDKKRAADGQNSLAMEADAHEASTEEADSHEASTRETDAHEASTREADSLDALVKEIAHRAGIPVIPTDAFARVGIDELKKAVIARSGAGTGEIGLTDGLVDAGDIVVLVTPIDSAAPKGRMILPQQQVMRDILDKGAIPVLTREFELKQTLAALKDAPKCVITDSQAFKVVANDVPRGVPLTSFSILFARQKGDLRKQLDGIRALSKIKAGDRILIAEACSHHRQEDDIGTVKIPRLIRKLKPDVEFEWVHGGSFPRNLAEYKLVIHCGACMIGRSEMQYRIDFCNGEGAPVTNYGLVLAYVNGILERAIAPFEDVD